MANKKNKGIKRGSAEHKNHLAKLESDRDIEYQKAYFSGQVMAEQEICLMLAEYMGWGPKTFAKAQEYMTMTRLRWSEVVVADGQCDDKLWYTKAKVDEVLLKHLPKDMQLDWDTRLDMSRHTIGFRFGPTKQEMIESGKYAELDAKTKKES